ncbi:MAG: TonB family protein [Holophagales bacterium]|nr:TonB family protein [Holophagales bacterium]
MSRELEELLRKRGQAGGPSRFIAFAISFGIHSAVVASILFWPEPAPKIANEKIRWVTLPASGGASGGSAPTEEGKTRGRQRRVEETAPERPVQEPLKKTEPPKPILKPQNPPVEPPKDVVPPAKPATPKVGPNPNPDSKGTATVAAKGANPTKVAVPGAAGSGGVGGVGQGSGIPGLKPTKGGMGGTGILQEFIGASDFPLWYAQQIQDSVTKNWIQMRSGEGRVLVYFRIKRDGKIEAPRVDISSGKADMDDMALQAVKRTTLPRLPEEYEGETLGVRFWFNYGGQ